MNNFDLLVKKQELKNFIHLLIGLSYEDMEILENEYHVSFRNDDCVATSIVKYLLKKVTPTEYIKYSDVLQTLESADEKAETKSETIKYIKGELEKRERVSISK